MLALPQIAYIRLKLEQEATELASKEWVVAHEALLAAGEDLRAWGKGVAERHPRFAEIAPLFDSNRPPVHRRLEQIILWLDASTVEPEDEEWSDLDDTFIEF